MKKKRYEKGGEIKFETKKGSVSGIDDVRERAMARMASQLQDETGKVSNLRVNPESGELYDPESSFKPTPKNVSLSRAVTPKKAASKLPMPDFSNEDMDRMGLDEFKSKPVSPSAKSAVRTNKENTDVSDMTYSTDSSERSYKAPKVAPQAAPKAEPKPKKIRGTNRENTNVSDMTFPMKKGGMVSSASKRADGCAQRGKTRA